MGVVRLQKYLSMSGIASRRAAERLIEQGRVKVDGSVINEMGLKVNDDSIVEVDGKRVKPIKINVYIMLNKPEGIVTTVKDQFSRKTAVDLVRDSGHRVYPVGRLDYDTTGLLILTNDGSFTYMLTHPAHKIKKTYLAEVTGIPSGAKLQKLRKGLDITDFKTSPAEVRIIERKINATVVEIIIHEGKNRQVRKMFDIIGHPVIKLKRIAVGDLELGELPEGKWRYLTEVEIIQFRNLQLQ